MNIQDILIRLSLVFLLIALNAFFVAAEFSIVSVRRTRVSQLVESGDLQARTVQALQRSLDRLLSTTQLGITLSSLALGWLGESSVAMLLGETFEGLSRAISLPIAFFTIAYLQIVLGELCPKSLALIYPEPMARSLAGPVGVISKIFHPFIAVLNRSTYFLLRTFNIKADIHQTHRVSSEELQLIISTVGESAGLEAGEREILNNVFEFSEVTAEEVMIPRNRLTVLPVEANFAALLKEINNTGHSHYPVKGDSIDDIRGIINFKDLSLPLSTGEITLDTPIAPWIKPVRFFPESTPVSELLPVMQKSGLKLIVIVDEFGGTAGLLTLEDLIGEIVETRSLHDRLDTLPDNTKGEIQVIDEQTFLVQAQVSIEDINDALALSLPIADEYQTLGGFLLYHWQKIPPPGEILDYDNLQFTIVSTSGARLERIKIHKI